jgi:hypothetical protein
MSNIPTGTYFVIVESDDKLFLSAGDEDEELKKF